MRIRTVVPSLLVAIVCVMAPAAARAQQAVSVSFGGFVPTGADGRVDGDVLA